MGAEIFASPIVILITLVLVVGASAIHYRAESRRPVVSERRLLAGYLAVIVGCVAIAAVSSYVPQEEAASRWKVAADSYWSTQAHAFLVEFVLFSCVSLLGVAFVGMPIIFALARIGRATVPYVLVASVLVSMVAAMLLAAGDNNPSRGFVFTAKYLVGQHLLLSLSFCLAAGLPWRRARSSET